MFRDVAATDSGYNISRCRNQMASHGTIYDMTVDPMMEVVVTVGKVKWHSYCSSSKYMNF